MPRKNVRPAEKKRRAQAQARRAAGRQKRKLPPMYSDPVSPALALGAVMASLFDTKERN